MKNSRRSLVGGRWTLGGSLGRSPLVFGRWSFVFGCRAVDGGLSEMTNNERPATSYRSSHPSSFAISILPPFDLLLLRGVLLTCRFHATAGWLGRRKGVRPTNGLAGESGGGFLPRRLASSHLVFLRHRSCGGAGRLRS